PNSKPCAGQKIENRYIVLWEDGRIEAYTWSSYDDFKREFVEPNLEQIKRVEFDRLVQLSEPITPSFGSSAKSQDWGQKVIEAEALWQRGHVGENIVVGIIDTWVDPTHPQLANQFYVNQGEIPDNFIDDDDNGFVDDYYGYQFYQIPETPHMSPVQV